MDAVTVWIMVATITSIGAMVLSVVFKAEKYESERLTLENQELRDRLRKKDDELREYGKQRDVLQMSYNELTDICDDLDRKYRDFKKRGYIRNAYGTLQRYGDWLENGDKKPRPKPKKAKAVKLSSASKAIMDHFAKEDAEGVISVGEIEIDTTPKPLTRAEACLAILHEAKDAGFEWAQSAIEQFDEETANNIVGSDGEMPLSRAVGSFNWWTNTRENWDYWHETSRLNEVQSFKPKTQWPA